MEKAELVEAVASKAGLSKADSKKALDGFVAASGGALKKGDRLSLVGFGSFSVSKRSAQSDSVLAVDFFPEVRSTGAENRHAGRVITQEQLEEKIFEKCGERDNLACPRKGSFVESLLEETLSRLALGESVVWGDFGTFESATATSISKRSARTGRNPQTGKEIQIVARNVVKFKAGAELSK